MSVQFVLIQRSLEYLNGTVELQKKSEKKSFFSSPKIFSVFSREHLEMMPKVMEHTWKEEDVSFND